MRHPMDEWFAKRPERPALHVRRVTMPLWVASVFVICAISNVVTVIRGWL